MMIKWDDLLVLPKWCPLAKSGLGVKVKGKGTYKIDESIYISLSDYNFKENSSQNAPFITSIIWAPTEGIEKRVVNMEIEADEGKSGFELPPELLQNGAHTYSEILKALRSSNMNYMETASYRIASDGVFVTKQITAHPFTYYFRNPANDDDEIPIAIQYSLIGK